MMAKYALGVDFGTLSARALIAQIGTGREMATATMEYPHAVMDRALPCGKILPPDWALQHPQDYMYCLKKIIPEVIALSGVDISDIVGVGVDCTACTMIPVDNDGEPLCLKDKWAQEKHAWPKLWKHHGAQDEANRITQTALERGEKLLDRFGGKCSSEWLWPKVWEILNDAPEVYEAADCFMEAGDWIVFRLTGRKTKNSSMSGYKAMWSKKEGYPSKDFLAALDPRLENAAEEKLAGEIFTIGARAVTSPARARET